MAHAFWVIADLELGDLYVPQVLCENRSGRELFVFEADYQVESIAKGKAFLSENAASYDRCVFAREGQVQTKDGYVDVLILDVVEGKSQPSLTIIQSYRKSEPAGLTLLGNEVFASGSAESVPRSDTVASLHEGAGEHEPARSTWDKLNSTRVEAVELFR